MLNAIVHAVVEIYFICKYVTLILSKCRLKSNLPLTLAQEFDLFSQADKS